MIDFNDAQALRAADPGESLDRVYHLPEQIEEAMELATKSGVQIDVPRVDTLVVTGLGGSAIGGDLLRVYAADQAKVPIVVNRGYTLPGFVDEKTLVFVTSYSGDTEETLAAYEEAKQRKAQIVCITSGGELAKRAKAAGDGLVEVPQGYPPRTATGYLLFPAILLLDTAALITGGGADVRDVLSVLRAMRERYAPENPVENNLAKQIAQSFVDRLPVIWGASGTTEAVAMRWKTQINENAKAPAYWNLFSELNHNEINGFQGPADVLQKMQIVILRTGFDHPRIHKRMSISADLIKDQVAGVQIVEGEGETALGQAFSLLYLGDFASLYLALAYGIDPTPVPIISQLKQALAEG
ncbi:MAG: bifunctional phosphoglucose/phosphomannose isomerase [Firmicutes bacterium]|nr:bifunctional phosphoglucose/phosphomannose isomerase [Bacillota bacterium]